MTLPVVLLAMELVRFHGPDGQIIDISPQHVVSIRNPRHVDLVAEDIKCLLHTDDGKAIAIIEDCETAYRRLGAEK